MKRLLVWLITAAVGFGFMAFSYFNYQYESGSNPWQDAFMYIGKGRVQSETEAIEYTTSPIRLLPMSHRVEDLMPIAHGLDRNVEKAYRVSFQEKVVLYSGLAADFTDKMLERGRLPSPHADEVVAGFEAADKNELTIDGRTFKVVGRFDRQVRLFANSYLVADDATAGGLFNANDEAVQQAFILRMPKKLLRDSQTRERLAKVFPESDFVAYHPMIRTPPGAFCLYFIGLVLLFLGGSLALYKLYRLLADRPGSKWLHAPLVAIRQYGYLLVAVDGIYFGTALLFMLVAYCLPELQFCLLSAVKSQVANGSGPLGVAGQAYMSKSIPLAAAITFVVNFLIGSFAVITLPSIILPGVGVLVAAFRAMLWGLLLAPTFDVLSRAMLPHSLTLLLEGEAYVIAAFFGLLVPIFLFSRTEGPSVGHRYGKALLLNLKGNFLVISVLVIAAIYEAIEVIVAMS
jgi:hypothetical protein